MKADSDDQSAVFIISEAVETAVALVEWAENSSDTPASFRNCFSQRAIVAEVTR